MVVYTTRLNEHAAPERHRDLRGTDRIKGVAGPSLTLLGVPHKEVECSSAEEYLMHSGVVDLPRTIVKLHSHVLQRVASQLNADSADLFRRALRGLGFSMNNAVHQAGGNNTYSNTCMFDVTRVEVQG